MTPDRTQDFNPADPGFIAGQREYALRTAIRDMLDARDFERVKEILLEEAERRAAHA